MSTSCKKIRQVLQLQLRRNSTILSAWFCRSLCSSFLLSWFYPLFSFFVVIMVIATSAKKGSVSLDGTSFERAELFGRGNSSIFVYAEHRDHLKLTPRKCVLCASRERYGWDYIDYTVIQRDYQIQCWICRERESERCPSEKHLKF